jgi:hypothetical protein
LAAKTAASGIRPCRVNAAIGPDETRYPQHAERLDQVEDERFLGVVVGVQETDKRVQSGHDAGAFNKIIKTSIGVVEYGVEAVRSAPR